VASTYMVIATIRDDTDMGALMALIPDEVAAVERLRAEGRLGAVHVAMARRVIFLETYADDVAAADATVLELPMGRYFDLDVYETTPPPA
jgi:hypothetical protein